MKRLSYFLIFALMLTLNVSLSAFAPQDSTKTAAVDSVDPNLVIQKYVEAIGGK